MEARSEYPDTFPWEHTCIHRSCLCWMLRNTEKNKHQQPSTTNSLQAESAWSEWWLTVAGCDFPEGFCDLQTASMGHILQCSESSCHSQEGGRLSNRASFYDASFHRPPRPPRLLTQVGFGTGLGLAMTEEIFLSDPLQLIVYI